MSEKASGKATEDNGGSDKTVWTNHDASQKKYHTEKCKWWADDMATESFSHLRRLGFAKCSHCRSIEQGDTGHTSDRLAELNPEDLGLAPVGER